MNLQAITASLLASGDVVFLSEGGDWVEALGDAALFSDEAALAPALDSAKAQVTTVVDAYPVEVRLQDDLPVPTSYRERVRALGPTIHPDMGKQALGGPVIEAIAAATGAARSTGRVALIRKK